MGAQNFKKIRKYSFSSPVPVFEERVKVKEEILEDGSKITRVVTDMVDPRSEEVQSTLPLFGLPVDDPRPRAEDYSFENQLASGAPLTPIPLDGFMQPSTPEMKEYADTRELESMFAEGNTSSPSSDNNIEFKQEESPNV